MEQIVEEKPSKLPVKRGRRKKTEEDTKLVEKKVSSRKPQVKTKVVLQYQSIEVELEELLARAKAEWLEEHQEEEIKIKQIDLYIKPEENCAYYVINDSEKGRIDFNN